MFIGYAIPAFAFGMLLKMFLSGTTEGLWDIFPVSRFYLGEFRRTVNGGQGQGPVHAHVPAGHLLHDRQFRGPYPAHEEQACWNRSARITCARSWPRAPPFNRAIWGHAFRNSLIPIATGFGSIFTLIFAGSVLIEKVFEIPGMGLLSLDAIVRQDYMVFMGILALTSILGLIGRIFSDRLLHVHRS